MATEEIVSHLKLKKWREMQNNKRPKGFVLREMFEEELRGLSTVCGQCGKSGVICKDLSVVYSETDTPFGRTYSAWGICEECKRIYPEKK